MRCVAIVKAGGICGGNRLDLDARDIFGGLDNDLSRTGNVCSVPVGLFFFYSFIHPPTRRRTPLCVSCLPGTVPFFLLPFFRSINPTGLATCSPKRTGPSRDLFWAANRFSNLDTFSSEH